MSVNIHPTRNDWNLLVYIFRSSSREVKHLTVSSMYMKSGPQTTHKAARRNVKVTWLTLKQQYLCLLASTWFTLLVRWRSAHGPLTVRSRSAHGPLTVRSRSAHGLLTIRSGYAQGKLRFTGNIPCLYLDAALHTDGHAQVTKCPNWGTVCFVEISDSKANELLPYFLGKFRNVLKANWRSLDWHTDVQCKGCTVHLTVSLASAHRERTRKSDRFYG